MQPFHLAFPVLDLESARRFYRDVLGCIVGREADAWIDFDFHGHQISAHRVERMPDIPTNDVDGHDVPVSHFGIVLATESWEDLRQRLEKAGIRFLIPPHVRFAGETGEQRTMFVLDPSGNGLEFKSFANAVDLFSRPVSSANST